ncbi:MAG: ATP-binding cassette domain-containing protein [Dehalococcoidia bacterium]
MQGDTLELARSQADATGDIIEVRDLVKLFPLKRGLRFWKEPPAVRAVDGVSFTVRKGEAYGLVGESGSGKSTIAKLILLLEQATSGHILFEGRDTATFSRVNRRQYRTNVQAVFQNPKASLNPRMRVGEIVGELLMLHEHLDRKTRNMRVADLFQLVGLPAASTQRFPHEFSGGQHQRIAIARAISTTPRLLVLDEPVSALDVSIRAQVLNLLGDLRRQFDLTYLLIAHDLAVVQRVSDVVGVLYLGKLVEECTSETLTDEPLHPYTKALLSAVPIPDPTRRRVNLPIEGEIASALNPPSGCRFHPRCPVAIARCSTEEPPMLWVSSTHRVACHLVSGRTMNPTPSEVHS